MNDVGIGFKESEIPCVNVKNWLGEIEQIGECRQKLSCAFLFQVFLQFINFIQPEAMLRISLRIFIRNGI